MPSNDTLQGAVNYLLHLPEIIKFLALTFSVSIEYIFPIFPGDTIVILAGFLHAKGAMDIAVVASAICVGSILGAYMGYLVGRLLNKPSIPNWAKKLRESKSFAQFDHWYKKWGVWFLLFNRFFHGIRFMFFVAAGATNFPLAKVLLFSLISAVIFNTLLVSLGYFLGFKTDLILNFFYRSNVIIVVITSLVLALIFYWYKKHKK
jgi:membrane protein DedA with SNARE-associated domain